MACGLHLFFLCLGSFLFQKNFLKCMGLFCCFLNHLAKILYLKSSLRRGHWKLGCSGAFVRSSDVPLQFLMCVQRVGKVLVDLCGLLLWISSLCE